ncbi:Hypothetical protein RMHFA_03984 [Roseomonas mucosa]|nr:hypothetical protein HVIM_03984 [Roseomonas mucosa]QDD98332.1 hypothetical protein ADP8_03984 [Roseomonas mucosa]UZO90526.1 Hypothetical protein RMP42_03984 [Roseomonas mucosa]UZO95359.1 Hypothetical protein RMHFA_03984 [Roseomonas mucosa]
MLKEGPLRGMLSPRDPAMSAPQGGASTAVAPVGDRLAITPPRGAFTGFPWGRSTASPVPGRSVQGGRAPLAPA